jgi:hypothetical protein
MRIKPGEGMKMQAASPQKKADDLREQQRIKQMIMSHDLTEQQKQAIND